MNAPQQFPNDDNVDVLHRMSANGDDLSQPRMIDFCFIFPERRQALAFTEIVDDLDKTVCISHYKERDMWQVIVQHYMLPTYKDITNMESALTIKAEKVGGTADGWGCMEVKNT
jgi:hypothetical protein